MRQIFYYVIRGIISLLYCMIVGLLIYMIFGIEWGSGVIMGGFTMLVLGILKYSSGGSAMPYVVQDNPTSMSTDSSGLRGTMDIGTLVKDAEKDVNTSHDHSHMLGSRPRNILDYMYRRTIIELILGGILGMAIGISTYWAYFI